MYGYNFTEYQQQYSKAKAQNPRLVDCPRETPYYDRNGGRCVACSGEHRYFKLHTNLCQSCGDQSYDPETRKCLASRVSVGPTLERLIMNII